MTEEGWEWRVGVLHGIGECMWEEKGGKIRKITKFIWNAQVQSMTFFKSMVGGGLMCMLEVDKGDSVVFSGIPDDPLINGANHAWEPPATILRPQPTIDFRKAMQQIKGKPS